MSSPYISLVESWKDFPATFSWGEPGADEEWSVVVPLELGGVTIHGFGLRMKCHKRRWEQDVLMQLEAGVPGLRTRIPLVRVEWRPLQDLHRDPPTRTEKRRIIRGSHVHPFRRNFVEKEARMLEDNLPWADPLSPDPESFEGLLDVAKNIFRINGIEGVRPPPWESKLV